MSEIYIRLFLTVARAIENKKDGGTKKAGTCIGS